MSHPLYSDVSGFCSIYDAVPTVFVGKRAVDRLHYLLHGAFPRHTQFFILDLFPSVSIFVSVFHFLFLCSLFFSFF